MTTQVNYLFNILVVSLCDLSHWTIQNKYFYCVFMRIKYAEPFENKFDTTQKCAKTCVKNI